MGSHPQQPQTWAKEGGKGHFDVKPKDVTKEWEKKVAQTIREGERGTEKERKKDVACMHMLHLRAAQRANRQTLQKRKLIEQINTHWVKQAKALKEAQPQTPSKKKKEGQPRAPAAKENRD